MASRSVSSELWKGGEKGTRWQTHHAIVLKGEHSVDGLQGAKEVECALRLYYTRKTKKKD
jgi:hypothetical protein